MQQGKGRESKGIAPYTGKAVCVRVCVRVGGVHACVRV